MISSQAFLRSSASRSLRFWKKPQRVCSRRHLKLKLLLDECVDQRLRSELDQHEVKSVADMGWSTLKDGERLSAAQYEFDALITVDRNLPYQQHLPKFRIAVSILRARTNRLADFKTACPARPGGVTDCAYWRSNNCKFLKLHFVCVEASQRPSSGAPHDTSTALSTPESYEPCTNFRHVFRRRLERRVGLRHDVVAQS